MKLTSHIICIFALIAQIFLSSVAFSHDVTCQSSRSITSEGDDHQSVPQHRQSCGCGHYHAVEMDGTRSDHIISSEPAYPPTPCTCSSESNLSFIAAEYSIETRERSISLVPMASFSLGHSFITLPNIPTLYTVDSDSDRIGSTERIMSIHLAKYSGRFSSTHLSKFLL